MDDALLAKSYNLSGNLELSHRPELDLLIACALPAGCPETGSRVRASLALPLDWNKLRELGAYHRVQPLLYERLTRYAADAVPANVAAELATEFRSGVARNFYLTGELISLIKAFAAANIPVIPHKGPVLAQAAYGDLALREFCDLDVLIHPNDLPAAIGLLVERGFLPPRDLAWLSPHAAVKLRQRVLARLYGGPLETMRRKPSSGPAANTIK